MLKLFTFLHLNLENDNNQIILLLINSSSSSDNVIAFLRSFVLLYPLKVKPLTLKKKKKVW